MSEAVERIPAHARPTAQALVAVLRALLGDDCAVVVHGSIALGEYMAGRSDLDVLVFVYPTPHPDALRGLAQALLELSGAPVPIELSVLSVGAAWVHPAPYWYHYSEAWRGRTVAMLADPTTQWLATGSDPDLTAHAVVARACGIVVWGHVVLPPVAARDAYAAVWYDIAGAVAEVVAQPVYVLLNLCRTILWLEHGQVLGKTQGGQALLPELTGETAAVVAAALESRRTGAAMDVPAAQLQAVAGALLARVERAAARL